MDFVVWTLVFFQSMTAVSSQGFSAMEPLISPAGSGNGIHSVANSNPSLNARPNGAGGAPNNPAMETVQNPNRFGMAPFLGQQGGPGTDFNRPSNIGNPDPNTLINRRARPQQPPMVVKLPHMCHTTSWSTDTMVVMPMPMSRMKTAVGTLPLRGGVVMQQGRGRIPFSMGQIMVMKMRNQMMSMARQGSAAMSEKPMHAMGENNMVAMAKPVMNGAMAGSMMNGMGTVPQPEPMMATPEQNMIGVGAMPQPQPNIMSGMAPMPEPNMMNGITPMNKLNMMNGMNSMQQPQPNMMAPMPEPNMMNGMASINGQTMMNGIIPQTTQNKMNAIPPMSDPVNGMGALSQPEPHMMNVMSSASSSGTNIMGNNGLMSIMSMTQNGVPSQPKNQQQVVWAVPSANVMVAMSYPTPNGATNVQRVAIY
ncbi:uncharacterized protein LOC133192594 [Saccostrea echinata]|uniref:uncharacterized protein LOC133192594 n=1 Tax=Saccostrea echinata TaxID=191078 RepID=UPI002A82E470|nr:uncharacterized protein LOC133192594 [Saccostrea echinata]